MAATKNTCARIEPFVLFNLLQGRGSEPLLLLDARSVAEYLESHIVGSISIPPELILGETDARFLEKHQSSSVSLSKIRNRSSSQIVIYTMDASDGINGKRLADLLAAEGCKVAVLTSGFIEFQTSYPFVCETGEKSSKLTKLYPAEVIPGSVFLGGQKNAESLEQLDLLNISAVVNCATEMRNYFPDSRQYLGPLPLDDTEAQEIKEELPKAIEFIDRMREQGRTVLIHCAYGQSRSASIALAYLISNRDWTFDRAFEYLHALKPDIRPNPGFIKQLRAFEREIHSGRHLAELISSGRQNVLHSGYIGKKGGGKGNSRNWLKGGSRAMRRRYVEVCAGGVLFYFVSEEERSRPKGFIRLTDATVKTFADKPARFLIQTPERDIEFQAESKEECDTWVAHIHKLLSEFQK